MTLEEMRQHEWSVSWSGGKRRYEYCNIADAIEEAIEALEKAEKYKWHDLRKNPNDLPNNGYYDTWSYWHEKYQNVRAFYNSTKDKWIFHPDNNTGRDWVEGLSIIAWREIEPFEEEKETTNKEFSFGDIKTVEIVEKVEKKDYYPYFCVIIAILAGIFTHLLINR